MRDDKDIQQKINNISHCLIKTLGLDHNSEAKVKAGLYH